MVCIILYKNHKKNPLTYVISCLPHVAHKHYINMATLLTLKDTSLLLSRSALFPTRATKAPGPARWANSSTNSFAFSNECLCVMSYTTRALAFAKKKSETEISHITSATIMSWSRRTLLRRVFAERTNEHGLGLRSLNFLKNHLIIFVLIVKRFLPSRKVSVSWELLLTYLFSKRDLPTSGPPVS